MSSSRLKILPPGNWQDAPYRKGPNSQSKDADYRVFLQPIPRETLYCFVWWITRTRKGTYHPSDRARMAKETADRYIEEGIWELNLDPHVLYPEGI